MSKLFGNLMRSFRSSGCFEPDQEPVPADPRRLFGIDLDRFSDNLGRARHILDDGDLDKVDLSPLRDLPRHAWPPHLPQGRPQSTPPSSLVPEREFLPLDELERRRRYGMLPPRYQDQA